MPLDALAIPEPPAMDGEPMREAHPETRQSTDKETIPARLLRWSDPLKTINVAEEIKRVDGNDSRITEIGMRVVEEAKLDDDTRSEWLTMSRTAMDLAMLVAKGKSYPWPNSSNVIYPLMSIAAVQFAARSYPAIVADQNVVRGVVFGDDDGKPLIDPNTGQQAVDPMTGEPLWELDALQEPIKPGILRDRADRIGEHMSWQLLQEQPEWEAETDTLLHILPIVGCAFRKSFFDHTEKRNAALLVVAKNLIINYSAKSVETAPRLTEIIELYPHEIEEQKRAGIFLDQDYGPPEGLTQDKDAPHKFYEQHRRLDLDGDGYTEPYVVTVHLASQKLARIVPRYDPEGVLFSRVTNKVSKIIPVHYYTKYDFLPNPDGGIYGLGFGQLLGPINQAVNSALNQIFDAATLQNTGGGFIGKGLSMHTGAVRLLPGEYKVVNAPGRTIRDAIVPLDHKGPSPVLFELLGFLVEAGKDVASIKDILTGDRMAANTPATTILALIEQGLKTFTAIFKRVHRSLKSEYDKAYRLNRIYLEESSRFLVGQQLKTVRRVDYLKGSAVAPVSDPKSVSDMQKIARAELLRQYRNDPLCDGMAILRRIFEAAGVDDIDELLKPNPSPDPTAMLKDKELQIKEMVGKAQALHYMASSVKALAEADEKVAETFGTWITTQLAVLQQNMEALDGGSGEEAAGPSGNPGGPGGPVPGMAPPPGNGALSALLG